jgi:cell division protein ZapA
MPERNARLAKKRSVIVNIAGQRLTVKSDADETYIRTLAGYLDRRMEEVRSSSRPASSQKLAMLVALNLADELFQERRKRGELKQRVRDKASDILTYITKEQRKHASKKN